MQELKIVGQSPQRYDIPAKVDGSLKWAVDVKLPGMVHARNVKPPVAGATLVSIDESSVREPARIRQGGEQGQLRRGGLRAGRAGDPRGAAAQGQLAEAGDARRSRPPRICSRTCAARRPPPAASRPWSGNPDAALAGAAKVVEAEYDVPFQGHTAFGPAHAMADPSNGQMTIYSNDMKSYGMRNGVAQFLEMPRDQVRVVWMEGPQGYGRTAADDAGFEAAFLAKEIGRPVRVQWMRHEETAWDTKGPAFAVQDARRPRRAGQPRRARLRRARGRLQSPRLQRARHRADRAAHGHAARRRPPRGGAAHAVGHVRHPEPAHGDAGREPAARVGDAASHRQPARSRTARR